MTGTMDEDSILDAIYAEDRKPHPRQRYPATIFRTGGWRSTPPSTPGATEARSHRSTPT